MTELPQAFLSQMAAQLKGEMAAFLRTYDEPYQRGLRVNPWKRPTRLPDDCGERVPWEENGHYLALTSTAGADVLHEAGAWYLQEPSAMLPAAVLNAQPGGAHVLDLCAAPGGKSTQSGLRMGGQGVLVCNEPVWERAKILSQNIERMGIPNALVVSAYPDQLAQRWPEAFDAIQVDAPCSGEGMVPPSSGNTRGMVARKPRRMRQAAGGNPRPRGGNASSRRAYGLFHLHNEPHGKRGYGGCVPVAPRGFLAGSLLPARSRCAGRDDDVLSAPHERRGALRRPPAQERRRTL